MAFKNYFKGKSGKIFWANIAAMVMVLVAVPVVTLYMLDIFTHHGEKIEVPNLKGKSLFEAEQMLTGKELTCIVNDSTYDKYAEPGSVIDQHPKAGSEVKSGRVIYLTVNLKGEPTVKMPDLSYSLRETMSILTALQFKLTPNEIVYGEDKDRVLGVKQGIRTIHAGELITRDRPLTIVVGGGEEPSDSLDYEEDEYEDAESDFDVDL